MNNSYYGFTQFPDRDTLINNELYTVFKNSGPFLYWGSAGNLCNYSTPAGFVRQDSSLRKVFIRFENDTTDHTLYNFNQQPGDTLDCVFFNNDGCPGSLIVDYLDSVLIGGLYHKKISFSQGNTADAYYIIEGVGSNMGLFPLMPCPFEAGTNLTCFNYNNGESLYPSANACDPLHVNSEFNSKIAVFPNPFAHTIIVHFETSEKVEFCLLDLPGNKVMSATIENNDIIKLNVPPGIYFYKIYVRGSLKKCDKIICIK